MMEKKLSSANQSVEKTLRIIEAMALEKDSLRLTDLAKKVQMPASTVLRMVNTLVEHGYAYQYPDTSRYGLTMKFSQLGGSIAEHLDLRLLARPYLRELSEVTQEAVCIAVEDRMEMLYIDVVDGPDGILKITQRIGRRAPMHSTGVGKLLLLGYTPQKLRELEAQKGMARLTEHTITTLDELERELALVRSRSYAMDDEECEIGVRCVAAPIRRYDGKIVAAISVSAPVNRMTPRRIDSLIPALQATAVKISGYLGYDEAAKP